ncbi:uncharacterized protein B0T23DRAFT_307133 [Neurospora hispaniola]|uniref:Uncharacterized protein n=1 Tax=Neurospora hispaniola TaxID=588809 RepID=A0AAJ0IH15_9PEZI|nr:hypothetical protein B0T23DRAFT_307133 [Neurospora hispaniola]
MNRTLEMLQIRHRVSWTCQEEGECRKRPGGEKRVAAATTPPGPGIRRRRRSVAFRGVPYWVFVYADQLAEINVSQPSPPPSKW